MQKHAVIQCKTKMHTGARYFALNSGLNGTSKDRNCNEKFVKDFTVAKINRRGSPNMVRGVGKKLISRGTFI